MDVCLCKTIEHLQCSYETKRQIHFLQIQRLNIRFLNTYTQMSSRTDIEGKINGNYIVMQDESLKLLEVLNLFIHMAKVYI